MFLRHRLTHGLEVRRQHLRPTRAEWSAPLQHTGRRDPRGDPLGRMAKPQHRLALVVCSDAQLAALARARETTAHSHAPVSWALRRPLPGVGTILALVMLDELDQIARFPRGPAFLSSTRLVQRARESHGQRPGTSGTTSGHAHRTWAFSAAAGLLRQNNEPAQQSLATRATQHGHGKALTLLAYTRGRVVSFRRTHRGAFTQAKCLATAGWRARTPLASHGSHWGKRPPLRSEPSDQAHGLGARTRGGGDGSRAPHGFEVAAGTSRHVWCRPAAAPDIRLPNSSRAWQQASGVSLTAWAPSVHSRAVSAQSLVRRVDRWLQNNRLAGHQVFGPLSQPAGAEWGTNALARALDSSTVWETSYLVRIALIYGDEQG